MPRASRLHADWRGPPGVDSTCIRPRLAACVRIQCTNGCRPGGNETSQPLPTPGRPSPARQAGDQSPGIPPALLCWSPEPPLGPAPCTAGSGKPESVQGGAQGAPPPSSSAPPLLIFLTGPGTQVQPLPHWRKRGRRGPHETGARVLGYLLFLGGPSWALSEFTPF